MLTIMLSPFLLTAQNIDTLSTSAKIDSIYNKLNSMQNMQKQMYTETRNAPLANKKYGIECNLFRLIALDEIVSFSGTFSLFDINRNAEIAFPIFYLNPKESEALTEFTLDCHYRYFLGNTQNGFYISGFSRYAYLRGTIGLNKMYFWDSTPPNNETGSENKFGIGFGIGYRIFSYKGFYWGTSVSIGRYIIGKSDKFMGYLDNDNSYIIDFELLKFGWAF
jgi:hypothetical protein